MSIFKKLFGGGANGDDEFAAFVEAGMAGLQAQTAAHQGTWHLGEEERWDFDQNSGMLVLTFADTIAKAPAQIVGTFDGNTKTWLWAWANRSIAEPLKRDALKVLDYGKARGIAKLTTAKWPAEEMDGWRMAGVANRVCSSNGAYRGPAGSTLIFMTFGEIQLSKRQ